jgi:hypothetical protein
MWSQLGVLGSRVVEAVFVSEDAEISEGRGVGQGTVGAVMEGNDVKALIAKRLGISKDKVDARLIALHNKGELAGTADRHRDQGRPTAGPSGHVKSPTLTKKDLEDFKRSEAKSGTPFKSFKPAVLGATPRTPRTPPAAHARPPTPEPAKDDEVEVLSQPQAQPPRGKPDWSEEMDEEEALPVPAPMDPAKSEGSGGGTVGAMEGDVWQDPAKSEGSGGGTVGAMDGSDVWQEPRKRYVEAVEAEHLFGAIEAIEGALKTSTRARA